MKCLALATFSLALATSGCRSAHSAEPVDPFDPRGVRPVAAQPRAEFKRQTPATPSLFGDNPTQRQQGASVGAQRLDRLDDRVSALKARCDERADCITLEPSFKQLQMLRAKVLMALAQLRDPMVGFDAGENGVAATLSEMTFAVEALTLRLEEVSPRWAI